jgi:hypothetical protein
MILCVFLVPLRVIFEHHPIARSGLLFASGVSAAITAVDFFFIIDTVFHFRLGTVDDGEMVKCPQMIAEGYLMGWFACDVVASLCSMLALSSNGHPGVHLARLPKCLRLFMIEPPPRASQNFMLFAKCATLFAYVTSITHLIACGSVMVSTQLRDPSVLSDSSPSLEGSWVEETFGAEFGTLSPGSVYLAAMYYTFVTITSVGYGDISPKSDPERVFTMVTCLAGSALFAFLVGELTSIATSKHANDRAFAETMYKVEGFLSAYRMPKDTRLRVRAHYHQQYHGSTDGVDANGGGASCCWFDTKALVETMPYELRKEVRRGMRLQLVKRVPFLRGAANEVLVAITRILVPCYALAGEPIVLEGEVGTEMFLIERGEVEVRLRREQFDTTPGSGNSPAFMSQITKHKDASGNSRGTVGTAELRRQSTAELQTDVRLSQGAFFGEIGLLCAKFPRTASVYAASDQQRLRRSLAARSSGESGSAGQSVEQGTKASGGTSEASVTGGCSLCSLSRGAFDDVDRRFPKEELRSLLERFAIERLMKVDALRKKGVANTKRWNTARTSTAGICAKDQILTFSTLFSLPAAGATKSAQHSVERDGLNSREEGIEASGPSLSSAASALPQPSAKPAAFPFLRAEPRAMPIARARVQRVIPCTGEKQLGPSEASVVLKLPLKLPLPNATKRDGECSNGKCSDTVQWQPPGYQELSEQVKVLQQSISTLAQAVAAAGQKHAHPQEP